jgi:hypothetical protein
MKNNLLFTVFIAAIVMISGCTSPPQGDKGSVTTAAGSKDTLKSETGTEDTNAGAEPGKGTTATAKTTATTAGSSSGGLLGDVKSEFKKLFSGRSVQYMVNYNTRIAQKGQAEMTGTMAYYLKGQDKVRIDSTLDSGGMGETRIYIIAKSAIMCTQQTGEWSCMKFPQGADSNPQDDLEQLQKDIDKSTVQMLPDRNIAGVNTKCFKVDVSSTAGSSVSTVSCMSGDGVPLYMESGNAEMSTVMEATKYTTSVSDADFTPPAEPQDLSQMYKDLPTG